MHIFQYSKMSPQSFLIFRGASHFLFFNAIQLITVQEVNLRSIYSRNWKLILFRSSTSSMAIAVGFFSLKNIPLSIYAVISELSPLFAILTSALILRECINPIEFALCISALIGTIFVIQPPIDVFGFWQISEKVENLNYFWLSLSFLAPLAISLNFVLLRKMSNNSTPVPLSVATFGLAVGCFIVGSVIQISIGKIPCLDYLDIAALVFVTVVSILNQGLGYYANKFEKSPIVAITFTLKVPILLVADFLFFPEESTNYNLVQYIGGSVVLISIIAILACSYFKATKQTTNNVEEKLEDENELDQPQVSHL